jgi:hypothetical protein
MTAPTSAPKTMSIVRSCRRSASPSSPLFLNILSMRSVIRKPPTTLVDEQATAIVPRIVLSGL